MRMVSDMSPGVCLPQRDCESPPFVLKQKRYLFAVLGGRVQQLQTDVGGICISWNAHFVQPCGLKVEIGSVLAHVCHSQCTSLDESDPAPSSKGRLPLQSIIFTRYLYFVPYHHQREYPRYESTCTCNT